MINFLKKTFDKMTTSEGGSEIFNLPNCITLLRLAVIPVLFLLLLSPGRILSMVIAVLFIIASITDLVDGYVARKYNIMTTVGKFLDPVADKLIVSTAMIMMIPIGRIPAWIVAVIIMRDLLVDGLRSVASA
ncbi:MAG: CDP-diacylglycerol--glycerol-3-phosphate 3-phosphatidyltransferase, partial [Thermodesulfobacteriota bacterium]|nr:CDP-diacylglycerol--glycerol-3-phosphate 3-phosphatidyltransferase [Thermodesulfobacteriota bacterium]